MRKYLYISFMVFIISCVFSAHIYAAGDPFDLSKYENEIKEAGIPTENIVKKQKSTAENLFKEGNYEEAVVALDEWAKSANWLANLITSGLEPFYSASYDDRENFSYSKISKLSGYESLANALKRQRNKAMVMKAESLVRLGKKEEALALYTKTLDLINIDNWDLWIRSLNGLFSLIEIDTVEK